MSDLERIRADLRLSDKRIRHTDGVVRMALTLARRHYPHLPETDVELAALMHDFTKEYTLEQQLDICLRYGIPVTDEDREKPKLLHARTAAALAEHRYGLSAGICSAIRWHTTGRPAMTPLESLIYFADYIEENRVYPSCVRLRAYYEKQLRKREPDKALLYGLAKSFDVTLEDLIEHKEIIDAATVEARNYYRRLIIKEKTDDGSSETD